MRSSEIWLRKLKLRIRALLTTRPSVLPSGSNHFSRCWLFGAAAPRIYLIYYYSFSTNINTWIETNKDTIGETRLRVFFYLAISWAASISDTSVRNNTTDLTKTTLPMVQGGNWTRGDVAQWYWNGTGFFWDWNINSTTLRWLLAR